MGIIFCWFRAEAFVAETRFLKGVFWLRVCEEINGLREQVDIDSED